MQRGRDTESIDYDYQRQAHTELVKENKQLARNKSFESLRIRELEKTDQNHLNNLFHVKMQNEIDEKFKK